jgi:sugar O-acyltransferase (sialic acid O-acetyltransferase NeuD family)
VGNERVIIVGFSGLGREILWTARRAQAQAPQGSAQIVGYTEKNPAPDPRDGIPCLGQEGPGLLESATHFICAIGDNRTRRQVCARIEAMGLKPISVIDPSVIIGPDVAIGPGCYVAAGSILSPGASLGRHVLINQGCTIGHDARTGDYVQACPGVRVSGWVAIGEGALLGSNAVAAPRISLGAWSTLGAASFASRDLPAGATALGIPARILFRREEDP